MTFIEFFDKTYIENICVSLLKIPDRIILVGGDTRTLSRHITIYDEIFKARGHTVLFEKRAVNKYNLAGIVEVLEAIVNTYEDCHFDLTGGDDLYLTAMGIVFERYRDKNINMHKYIIASDKLIDCDANGEVFSYDGLPLWTVSENIRLYGGKVLGADFRKEDAELFDEALRKDIDSLWKICSADSKKWNSNIGKMERLIKNAVDKSEKLSFSVTSRQISDENGDGDLSVFFDSLISQGLIEKTTSAKKVTVRYKNAYVKSCLEKSGKILEIKAFLLASDLKDENCRDLYTDIMSGVTVDWDGITVPDVPNIENEVDLILTHGVVPVFVSCKNGYVGVEELYKLNAVSESLGGRYAKKYLIAGSSENISKATKLRATELNISMIANVHKLSDKEFSEKLRSFVNNQPKGMLCK